MSLESITPAADATTDAPAGAALPDSATGPLSLSPAALERIDRWLAPTMFVVSLFFLVMVAGALQDFRDETVLPQGTTLYWWGLFALWPLFVAELILLWRVGSPFWRRHWLYCLLPPLRLGGRDHVTGQSIWLPYLHWLPVSPASRRRLEHAFSAPMIFFALLVLPVVALECFWNEQVQQSIYLSFFVGTATSVIWLAFTIEFIVMISIVSNKLGYCAKNWVDLLVILLPVVAFLRVLRLAQLARLNEVGRLSRLYRLRGLSLRAYRAVLVLGLLRYIIRVPPEKRLKALRVLLEEKEHELARIREEIATLQAKCEATTQPE